MRVMSCAEMRASRGRLLLGCRPIEVRGRAERWAIGEEELV
jgi:hypothetical protein